MRRVFVASPYAPPAGTPDRYLEAAVALHVAYAERCLSHSLDVGEAPYAPHLLYPAALDDSDQEQRRQGLAAGKQWLGSSDHLAAYVDHGISSGMEGEIRYAQRAGIRVLFRSLTQPRKQWTQLENVPEGVVGGLQRRWRTDAEPVEDLTYRPPTRPVPSTARELVAELESWPGVNRAKALIDHRNPSHLYVGVDPSAARGAVVAYMERIQPKGMTFSVGGMDIGTHKPHPAVSGLTIPAAHDHACWQCFYSQPRYVSSCPKCHKDELKHVSWLPGRDTAALDSAVAPEHAEELRRAMAESPIESLREAAKKGGITE